MDLQVTYQNECHYLIATWYREAGLCEYFMLATSPFEEKAGIAGADESVIATDSGGKLWRFFGWWAGGL